MAKNYLSIDIGGTNVKYGLLDHSGNLLEDGSQPTIQTNLECFLEQLETIIERYIGKIRGIAFSLPGKIEKQSGTIYFGGSLPFLHGVALGKIMAEKYGVPVSLENDGKAAALAEFWLGHLKGHPNSAAIVLGTGIGGGIFLDGQLLQGSHFQAGELSFMIESMSEKGQANFYGMSGSAVNMIRKIASEIQLESSTDGSAVFNEINNGNVTAQRLFKDYCRTIAQLILNLQSVIDVDTIVIGGGISAQKILVPTIKTCYAEILQANPIISQTFTPPEIHSAYFVNKANLYGALYGLLLQVNGEN